MLKRWAAWLRGIRVAAWLRGIRWAVGVLAAVVVALAIAWVVFVPAADWLATHDVGHVTGALRTLRLQTARDAARGRLLTLGAGLFAAGALIFTARNFTLSRRTFELTEQGQVTDRYTKAIEQLGSKKPAVRTGGIYALERVARDSTRDQFTVMEVLAAFIRDQSRKQRLPEPSADAVPPRTTRLDLQAAVTVIGRRNVAIRQRIDLAGAKLLGANLTGAELSDADLRSTDLSGANLAGANLAGAKLADAKLGPLIRTSSDAHLELTPAQLTRAEIVSVNLWVFTVTSYGIRADLTGADLTGADLTGTKFVGADLTGARLSKDMHLPEDSGWVQDPASGELRRTNESTGDSGN